MMVLTDTAISAMREALKDYIDANFLYVAFGTGSAAEASSQTALSSEVIRVARQDYQETVNHAVVSGFLSSTQANGNTIMEAGCFVTSGTSTGTALGRVLAPSGIAKTSDKEVWFDIDVGDIVVTQ
jgi:hypothetical protein